MGRGALGQIVLLIYGGVNNQHLAGNIGLGRQEGPGLDYAKLILRSLSRSKQLWNKKEASGECVRYLHDGESVNLSRRVSTG